MAITEEQIANGVKTLSDRGEPREKIAKFVRAARATQQQPQEQEQPQIEPQAPQVAFSPELVAGTPEQQSAARAVNFQRQMGFTDPVDLNAGLDMGGRMMLRAAPTGEEKNVYLNTEYGEGNWTHASNDKFFVKINDGKGGKKWVLNDPKGLDIGDVVEFIPKVPEFIAGFVTAAANSPTAAGGMFRLAKASGASALSSEIAGALVDIGFRFAVDKPINLPEIATRRGKNVAAGTAAGVALPKFIQAVGNKITETGGAKGVLRALTAEGQDAKRALTGMGYNPQMSSELAPEILARNRSELTAVEAGDAVGRILTQFDNRANETATKLLGGAARSVDNRAEELLLQTARATPKTQTEVGLGVSGGVKAFYNNAMQTAEDLYTQANNTIAAASGGRGAAIIRLPQTDALIKDMLGDRLVDASGLPIKSGAPLVNTLMQTLQATGTAQKLQAVRNLRTQLSQQMNGAAIFEGMDAGTAKRLRNIISKDMETSISNYTGVGAREMQQADKYYRTTIQSMDDSGVVGKIVGDKVQYPSDVVDMMSEGKLADWVAMSRNMPPNNYSELKRSVITKWIGGEDVMIAGQPYRDVISLGTKLRSVLPEVKNEIFGNPTVWRGLERIAKEQEFIAAKQGIFSKAGAISPDALRQAAADMRASGFDVANANLRRSMAVQEQRINSLHGSLVSQVKNGNFVEATKDPVALMDGLMSGKYRANYVGQILNGMPPELKDNVSKAAFTRIFDKSRISAESAINNPRGVTYNATTVADSILGTPEQRAALQALLGNERYATARNWVTYTLQMEREMQRKGVIARTAGRLLSVLPYPKLAAARLGSEVIETAAGKRVFAGINPQSAVLFAESRLLSNNPIKTAAANVIIQRATSNALYEDYQEMMSPLSMEQRNAMDAFMLGPKE